MTVKYTNRTCNKCGARRPQPDMNKKEIYVEVGKSNTTVTMATWLGAGFGDKAAQRAVQRANYNSGERTYRRKKTVWECKNCNQGKYLGTQANQVSKTSKSKEELKSKEESKSLVPIGGVSKQETKTTQEGGSPLFGFFFWSIVLAVLLYACGG